MQTRNSIFKTEEDARNEIVRIKSLGPVFIKPQDTAILAEILSVFASKGQKEVGLVGDALVLINQNTDKSSLPVLQDLLINSNLNDETRKFISDRKEKLKKW